MEIDENENENENEYYKEGYNSCKDNERNRNPYLRGTVKFEKWRSGWHRYNDDYNSYNYED